MKKSLLTLALCLVSLLATAQHFITDAAYRAKVDAAFQAKMKLIGEKFYRLDGLHATPQEQKPCTFSMLICLWPMQPTIPRPII